jgi:hypothetical protein
MSLTRSLIPQQHRPILDQLPVRLSLRHGQGVNYDAHQVVSHRSARRSGQTFDHLGRQIQQFLGRARNNEEKQGKNLCSENSQNGKADGNSGVPQPKTLGVRRRSAMTDGGRASQSQRNDLNR